MKKTVILLFIITSMFMTGATPNEPVDPLHTLTKIAEENTWAITNWEVMLKESISKTNFNDILNDVRNSHLVTRTEDENSIKYILFDEENTTSIHVDQTIIVSKTEHEHIELIAVMKGSDWNEEIQSEYDQTSGKLNDSFFQDKPDEFTCIEVIEDDTIENRAVIDVLTESLQLEHVEEQDDPLEMSKHKKIKYGYTPLWNEKFVIQGIPYNLQIVATQGDSGKLAYTIGTPILMNEY